MNSSEAVGLVNGSYVGLTNGPSSMTAGASSTVDAEFPTGDGSAQRSISCGPNSSASEVTTDDGAASEADSHQVSPGAPALTQNGSPVQNGQSNSSSVRRVSFGLVQVRLHECVLDGSKMPSDGAAPLGLGKAMGVTTESVDAFDVRRNADRKGVSHVSAEERREMLADIDSAELAQVEAENGAIIGATAAKWTHMNADDDDGDGSLFSSKLWAAAQRDGTFRGYTTAAPDDVRSGLGGGFAEYDGEEERR
mmetsp:Transcript_44096/g.92093  ORF Transcript_44096/g.92093 Transcript_44096/m.92093 type:complete len:251 (-) Transcript_44096:23-775(-)